MTYTNIMSSVIILLCIAILCFLAAIVLIRPEPIPPAVVAVAPPAPAAVKPPAKKDKRCIFPEGLEDCRYDDVGMAKVGSNGVKPYSTTDILTDDFIGY